MADRDENNRRKLPRVGSGDPQAKKDIAQNKKDIADNRSKINQQDSRLTDLTSRFIKTEAQARKAEQDASKAQTTANRAVDVAGKASNESSSNKSALTRLERDNKQKVSANVFRNLQSNFNVSNRGFSNSISGIQQNLNSSFLNLNTKQGSTEQELVEVNQRVSQLNSGLALNQATLQKTVGALNKSIANTQINNLALSKMVKEHFASKQKKASALEKSARIQAAQNRKKQREKILEGGFKAAANAGKSIGKTANAITGGFNLIKALKGVLGNLLLGVAAMNFGSIYQWAEDNFGKIQRFFILWGKKLLNPVKKFFNALLDFSFNAIKWIGKTISGIKSLISEALTFTTKLTGKVIDGLKAVAKFLRLARTPKPPAPTPSPNPGKGSSGSGAPGSVGGDAVTPRSTPGSTPGASPSPGGSPSATPSPNAPSGSSASPGDIKQAPDKASKNIFSRTWNFIKSIPSKISSIFTGLTGKFTSAVKKGPEALRGFVASSKGSLASVGGLMDGFIKKIGGDKLGELLSKGWVKGALKGIKSANPLMTFPIDYLLNRLIGGMSGDQAAGRATFSTIGSLLGGGALGLLTGNPFLIGTGAFLGGEVGDYIGANMLGMDPKSTTVGILGDIIPSLDNWLNGGKSSGEGNSDAASKVSVATPATPAVGKSNAAATSQLTVSQGSPSAASDGTLVASSSSASISSVPPSTSGILPNDLYRKPTKTSSMGGGNITTVNMPPETVQLPPDVVGGSRDRQVVNQTDAQPIPNISSGNPAMSFMDNLAASIFEVALV